MVGLAWPHAGDRNYLVLAKPNVIMNDIRLRGLAARWRSGAPEWSWNALLPGTRALRRAWT
jgi:hypothetical protein